MGGAGSIRTGSALYTRHFLTYNWTHPSPGSLSQEESSSQPTPILDEVPRDETQEHQPPQLEEEQRVWQRLEQLILGQLEELRQQLEQQEEELSRLRLGVVRFLGWA